MLKLKINYLLLIFTSEIAVFHRQRHGILSICLSGQKILATIVITKINQVLGNFQPQLKKQYLVKKIK